MKLQLARFAKYILDSALFKNAVVDAIVQAGGATSIFLKWLYEWLAGKLFEFVRKYIRREVIAVETKEERKPSDEKVEAVIKNPESTPEEIRNAGRNGINGD